MKNSFIIAFFGFLLICTLVFVSFEFSSIDHVSAQPPGVAIFIDKNTVWTKFGSPHTLNGPIFVEYGVTLTIEAGATVNLNNYELRVNGSLYARGTSDDPIYFVNGSITFTTFCYPWTQQSGSGSLIEYAIFNGAGTHDYAGIPVNQQPLEITKDTTWTKDNTYTIWSSIVVNKGVTLTLNPGVNIDLNYKDMTIKGTLRIVGNSNNLATVYDGAIIFESSSQGWNELTSSGSIIDHGNLSNLDITSSVPLKITNNVVNIVNIEASSVIFVNNIQSFNAANLVVGGSSELRDSEIKILTVSGEPTISNNHIERIEIFGGSPTITDNEIFRIESDGCASPIISGNSIQHVGRVEHSATSSQSEITYFKADSPVFENNVIKAGIYLDCQTATISKNTFMSYSYEHHWDEYSGMFHPVTHRTTIVTTPGVHIKNGVVEVIENKFYNCSFGVFGAITIERNLFFNNEYGVDNCPNAVIDGNTFFNCSYAAYIGGSEFTTVKNNLFSENEKAIVVYDDVLLEYNSFSGNNLALFIRSTELHVTIQKNTFSDNVKVIEIGTEDSTVLINYNNFENNGQYNIYLDEPIATTIDAKNNWWGTINTTEIGYSIYDFKYDFDLARVNIDPILTEPNPDAKPTIEPIIPELLTWFAIPLIAVLAVVVVFFRKKLRNKPATLAV